MAYRLPRLRAGEILCHPATFALCALTIYAVELAVARALPGMAEAPLVAIGMVADLTLMVPLLYYLMLVRGRGWPAFSVVPVFLASLAGAAWVVPGDQQSALRTVEWLAVPAELLVVGLLVTRAVQIGKRFGSHRADLFEGLRTAARETLGARLPSEILAFEAAILYYALFSWRSEPDVPRAVTSFSHHRKALYGTVVAGLTLAGLVEIVPVHVLIHVFWSPAAAWIVTALSLYGLLWIAGDYRAVVLRPSLLEGGLLRLRVGVRWNAEIPVATIRRIRKLDAGEPEPAEGYVRATLLGRPGHLLELDRPVEVRGLYGWRRRVETIGVTVDEAAFFEELSGSQSAG